VTIGKDWYSNAPSRVGVAGFLPAYNEVGLVSNRWIVSDTMSWRSATDDQHLFQQLKERNREYEFVLLPAADTRSLMEGLVGAIRTSNHMLIADSIDRGKVAQICAAANVDGIIIGVAQPYFAKVVTFGLAGGTVHITNMQASLQLVDRTGQIRWSAYRLFEATPYRTAVLGSDLSFYAGEDEFLINTGRTMLKDATDFLAGTFPGKTGYVVNQNKKPDRAPVVITFKDKIIIGLEDDARVVIKDEQENIVFGPKQDDDEYEWTLLRPDLKKALPGTYRLEVGSTGKAYSIVLPK
jgi:hypothetical protein